MSTIHLHIHDLANQLVQASEMQARDIITVSTAVSSVSADPFACYTDRMEALSFKFRQLVCSSSPASNSND